jgi:methionyl-tRNA synthetase
LTGKKPARWPAQEFQTMANKNFYITTTLPYVNAEPHVGFALEIVHADIVARYRRLTGDDVFFNTGTDEHGQKIFQKAQEEKKDTRAYVDEYAEKFRALKNTLGLSQELHFIRTTAPEHVIAAQEMWRRCMANVGPEGPDIYKKKYKGLYCVGDEMFLRESDLVDGRCPNHPTLTPVEIEEENYFFRLSRYEKDLFAYLEQGTSVVPEWRREEAINFVKGGLEDFSVSREKARLSWGIPVPGDESQVMYVWFDALTNYISTLGWPEDKAGNFKKFWEQGDVVQMAGKDQVRFQSIMWQAMLMSAGIKNSDRVVYHGFITSGGHKMSKSLGNVVDPRTLVEEYGTDAVRYFLARHMSSFEDSDFTPERFKEAYNADLANGLGNLASRIMQLAQTHLEKPVELSWREFPKELTEAMNNFEVNRAAEYVWSRIAALDQRITIEAPFKLVKTDLKAGQALIAEMMRELAYIDQMLEVFMPHTSKIIIDAVVANKKPENLFPRKE